ncbi:hypothetical protein CD117_12410 [Mammaliicoccus sciuri]|uniref:RNA helicase n=1 Tax=Mammaliicoccus sciuri TaxID=1296 RepID=A0AAJ4VH50_MAMSC|nr:hypothetical protein [Mammaliicoccus sciuri]RTX71306.1 hypothetical protein CD117_12410 [Mammaliicoccus sciuri]
MTDKIIDKKCGLIMPISGDSIYTEEHWRNMKKIFEDVLNLSTEFKYNLKIVSEKDDVGILQDNIVNGIYESDIIICDVSGRNPNVMFELGMRIAFDKPVVIVKDELTNIAFDIGVIEYIEYPSNLNYVEIEKFKNKLCKKIDHTIKETENGNNSSYLSRFGRFVIQELPSNEITEHKALEKILSKIDILNRNLNNSRNVSNSNFILNESDKERFLPFIKDAINLYVSEKNIHYSKLIYDDELKNYMSNLPLMKTLELSEKDELILLLKAVDDYKTEMRNAELPF